MWKDYFYFTRNEQQGIIMLMRGIICVAGGLYFWPKEARQQEKNKQELQHEEAEFAASLQRKKKEYDYKRYRTFEQTPIHLAPFDPNKTDSAGFVRLGLRPWMAHNIMRYRSKGGRFRKPEDFKRVYGLTAQQFQSLLPYITVEERAVNRDSSLYTALKRDSVKPFKYAAGVTIDLNTTDTTELKKIPGVGGSIARMIVGYRQKLGGFYDVCQLDDIRLNVEKLRGWFYADASKTQRINLNKASVERLKAHPYLNFYQAKVIVEHRSRYGAISNLNQLSLYNEFTPHDIQRISHYVCF
ncbi:MAG: helix-hairpin-helix domain-containing protein [Bacteroides graminisolvens]